MISGQKIYFIKTCKIKVHQPLNLPWYDSNIHQTKKTINYAHTDPPSTLRIYQSFCPQHIYQSFTNENLLGHLIHSQTYMAC